jgi:hypothetical protein
MLMKRRTNWTPEDNERLKAMAASGIPILKAAAAFKCTTAALRIRARQLGTPFPTIREVRKEIVSKTGCSLRFR